MEKQLTQKELRAAMEFVFNETSGQKECYDAKCIDHLEWKHTTKQEYNVNFYLVDVYVYVDHEQNKVDKNGHTHSCQVLITKVNNRTGVTFLQTPVSSIQDYLIQLFFIDDVIQAKMEPEIGFKYNTLLKQAL